MQKRYVLKSKRRFATVVTLSFLLLFTFIFATTVHGYKEKSFTTTILVKQGDTLWDIAAEYKKDNEIRKYIYEIKRINNLSCSQIYTGSKLVLP